MKQGRITSLLCVMLSSTYYAVHQVFSYPNFGRLLTCEGHTDNWCSTVNTIYWEIFEVQNFRGLVILKFFANKFSRMAIYTGNGHVHVF